MSSGPRTKTWATGLCMLAMVFTPLLWPRLNPNDYDGGRSRNFQDRQTRNASAIGAMLGEFRTGISDVLMLKTERYMDNGIAYEAHAAAEILGADDTAKAFDALAVQAGGGHDDHSGEGGPDTLIATPEMDYRGLIGHLHREVKPWRDPSEAHNHSDGKQMLPWYRVATMIDPKHVQSYTIGGYWLSIQSNAAAEEFLLQGIEQVPEAFQLYLMLGKVYYAQAKDMDGDVFSPEGEMLELCLKSKAAYRQAAELALVQRPEVVNETTEDVWGSYDEEDAWASFRMAAMTEKQYGSLEEAKGLAERIVERAGPDAILIRLIQSK